MVYVHNRKGCILGSASVAVLEGLQQQHRHPQQRRPPVQQATRRRHEEPLPPEEEGQQTRGYVRGGRVGGSAGKTLNDSSSGGGRHPEVAGFSVVASEAEDLSGLFAVRPRGFGGADVMASLALPPRSASSERPEETLWLLGDTFIGHAVGRTRLPGFFVRNSVAIVPRWSGGAREAVPEDVRFHFNRTKDGCYISLFRWQQDDHHNPADECANDGQYLWPLTGVGVRVEGARHRPQLVLLAVKWAYIDRIAELNDMPPQLFDFNFRVRGSVLIVVDNADEPPEAWTYRVKEIPGTSEQVTWHAGIALADPSRSVATGRDDVVYVLGSNGNKPIGTDHQDPSRQVLARCRVGDLLDLRVEAMEVWTEDEQWTPLQNVSNTDSSSSGEGEEAEGGSGGSQGEEAAVSMASTSRHTVAGGRRRGVRPRAKGLYSPVYTATSLQYNSVLGSWYTIGVDFIFTRIMLLTAPCITGPWTATPVYSVPPPYNDLPNLMAYSGKAHPELSESEHSIVISYIVNSPGLVDPLFREGATDLYVPRFVRLDLVPTPPPPPSTPTQQQTSRRRERSGASKGLEEGD